MDAISFLKRQHREAELLFSAIHAERSVEVRTLLFVQVCTLLEAHAALEEGLFYRALLCDKTEALLDQSMEAHLRIRLLLAELSELSPEDPGFDARLTQIQVEVAAHVASEEQTMMPLASSILGPGLIDSLGEVLERKYASVREGASLDEMAFD